MRGWSYPRVRGIRFSTDGRRSFSNAIGLRYNAHDRFLQLALGTLLDGTWSLGFSSIESVKVYGAVFCVNIFFSFERLFA